MHNRYFNVRGQDGAGASELAVSTLRHLMHPFGPSTVWQAIHGIFSTNRHERVSAVCWLFALLSAIVPVNWKLETLSPGSSAPIKLHLQTLPPARNQDYVCECCLIEKAELPTQRAFLHRPAVW